MKKIRILIIFGIVTLLFSGCVFEANEDNPTATSEEKKLVEIPQEILDNQFGFLTYDSQGADFIYEAGGAWARPHPGPFLWESIQISANSAYDFKDIDSEIKSYGKMDLGVLATLWPFADWDQAGRTECRVSENDQFLPQEGQDSTYLPYYRCNPTDWEAYQAWVMALVERYDGDGVADMPGLLIPVKYWEVMNEPDLQPREDGELQFYREDPEDYVELLAKTATAIRQADPEAFVVIAGAAGGSSQFLDFWQQVFNNKSSAQYFDIANIHCISNDNYENFNVKPYLDLLNDYGLDGKPVWVTEAEAMVYDTEVANQEQFFKSTQAALDLGAEKIFFTSRNFEPRNKNNQEEEKSKEEDKTEKKSEPSEDITGFKNIINQNK